MVVASGGREGKGRLALGTLVPLMVQVTSGPHNDSQAHTVDEFADQQTNSQSRATERLSNYLHLLTISCDSEKQ